MKSDSPKSVVDAISHSEKTTNTISNTIRQLNIQVVAAVRVVLKAVPGVQIVGKAIIHALYLCRDIGDWRRMGGLAYLVRDGKTEFMIPNHEPEELCEKISWLLNDPQMHATMSQRAVEYAQDYVWEKIAKQIVEVYEGLVRE